MSGAPRTIVTSLVLAGALAGCPSSPPSPCGEDDFTLEIGHGDQNNPTAYQALPPGSEVSLTAGNQGGRHIWIKLRARGVCPEHPRYSIRLSRTDDGSVIGLTNQTTPWTEVSGQPGLYETSAFSAQIYDDAYCTLLDGGHVTVNAHVDDQHGHTQSAETTVQVNGWSPDSDPTSLPGEQTCCANYSDTRCWPHGAPDGGADAAAEAATDAATDEGTDGSARASDAAAPDATDAQDGGATDEAAEGGA